MEGHSMHQSAKLHRFHPRSLRRFRIAFLIAACIVPTLLAGAFLTSCEPVDISGPAPIDTTDTAAGFATLRVSNRLDVDPTTVTILLFSGNAVDFSNAANAKKLGSVAPDSTVSFRAPAGAWKLAYTDPAGTLTPMEDVASGGSEWLKSVFKKNGDYSIILNSDTRGTVWVPNYTTIPAIVSP
jgi:hypothetical protein